MREFTEKYAGQYILLQDREVTWHCKSCGHDWQDKHTNAIVEARSGAVVSFPLRVHCPSCDKKLRGITALQITTDDHE